MRGAPTRAIQFRRRSGGTSTRSPTTVPAMIMSGVVWISAISSVSSNRAHQANFSAPLRRCARSRARPCPVGVADRDELGHPGRQAAALRLQRADHEQGDDACAEERQDDHRDHRAPDAAADRRVICPVDVHLRNRQWRSLVAGAGYARNALHLNLHPYRLARPGERLLAERGTRSTSCRPSAANSAQSFFGAASAYCPCPAAARALSVAGLYV